MHLPFLQENSVSGSHFLLLHIAGSSSEPSLQSASPSHFQLLRMQRPFELQPSLIVDFTPVIAWCTYRHFISSSGHSLSQFSSSELSPQSSVPSQIVAEGVQLLFLHWKVPFLHCLGGHVSGSSEPSLQSFSPSHLQEEFSCIAWVNLVEYSLPEPGNALFVVAFALPLAFSAICYARFMVWTQIELVGTRTCKARLPFFAVPTYTL